MLSFNIGFQSPRLNMTAVQKIYIYVDVYSTTELSDCYCDEKYFNFYLCNLQSFFL